jgi:hypothetical protein
MNAEKERERRQKAVVAADAVVSAVVWGIFKGFFIATGIIILIIIASMWQADRMSQTLDSSGRYR